MSVHSSREMRLIKDILLRQGLKPWECVFLRKTPPPPLIFQWRCENSSLSDVGRFGRAEDGLYCHLCPTL